MFRFIVVLSLVCFYLTNNATAVLSSCSAPSSSPQSTRLNATLTALGSLYYQGTLLLSSNGNFVLILSVTDVGSPVSAIQGTWSCSSNTFTLTGNTFYFLKMSMSTITQFQCTYQCASGNATPRSCLATYQVLANNQIGSVTFSLDLKTP